MEQVKHKSQRSETKLTPECRLAFIYVHEKRTKTAAGALLKSPRHDMLVLLPKRTNDPATCPNYKFLADMLMEAAAKEPLWGGGWPAGGKWPIQDGDVPYTPKPKPGQPMLSPAEIAAKNPWRRGHWIFEVSHNLEPGPKVAVMQNGQPVEIPARTVAGQLQYKSGDYGIVSLHAYTYQRETFGANFGFEGVLFTRPGEVIGSSGPRSAQQMFGSVAGTVAPPMPAMPGAGAAPAPAPSPGYAPPPAPLAYASTPATVAPAPPMPTAPASPPMPGLPPFPSR